MEPLGEGRHMHLKHMHTHTHTGLSTSNVLIRLMRLFTRLTKEVVLNHKKHQDSLIGLQELSDTKSPCLHRGGMIICLLELLSDLVREKLHFKFYSNFT